MTEVVIRIHEFHLRFAVPAVPVAQPRARAVAFGGGARMHEVTHIKNADGTRKPHPIAAFKASVQHAFADNYDGPPREEALHVRLVFVLPRPKRLIWKTRPMPREPHVGRPDIDNLEKSFLDALKGLMSRDDAQVFHLDATKWIAAGDEAPHVEAEMWSE